MSQSSTFALALLAVVGFVSACGGSPRDEAVGETSEALGSSPGCHTECPKCRPGEICPMIACREVCRGRQTCTQTALCIIGYEWSQKECRCVPTSTPAPGTCSTDADCRTFSDYCTGCDCRALSVSAPDPTCSGPGVRCVADPCAGVSEVCLNGTCSLN